MDDRTSPDDPNINLIIPQNLTAIAQHNVTGNPPSTRPESGVGNCYPGLEYDHRNLDRRFFPGLLVDYVSEGAERGIIRVTAVVADDPGLQAPPTSDPGLRRIDFSKPPRTDLGAQLRSDLANLPRPATGAWFIEAVTQANKRIALADDDGAPLFDLGTCWRLIRSLRHDLVTLSLTTRPDDKGEPPIPCQKATLAGWRRRYTDQKTGVINAAYRPGELTQSLCSPWTHDFRDCACTYWASNHPDIVAPAIPLGATIQPSGRPKDPQYNLQMNWLRNPDFPDLHATALPTQPANRPLEVSYYQINQQWQDLSVVVEGHETEGLYIPRSQQRDDATPLDPKELRKRLTELAELEHLVALLYLYAYFSVISPEEAATRRDRWPDLVDDVKYMRTTLMDIAVGEMQHLRTVNLVLYKLDEHVGDASKPTVAPPATSLPKPGDQPSEPAKLEPLTRETVKRFLDIERSSAYIDGQYSQVAATLRGSGYPPRLYELASTIADEGEEHFLNFTSIHALLKSTYRTHPVYLRPIEEGDPAHPDIQAALEIYKRIVTDLTTGYDRGDVNNQRKLITARDDMYELKKIAEHLAKDNNIGIPFLSVNW
jgi:hypothetical protein